VKVLTKENKEKENVLTDLELINLKNVSLLQSKELKIKIVEVQKRVVNGGQGVSENSTAPLSTVGKGIGTEEKFGSSWY